MLLEWLKALGWVEQLVQAKVKAETERGARLAYTVALSVIWSIRNEVEQDFVSDLTCRAMEEAPPRASAPIVPREQDGGEASGGAEEGTTPSEGRRSSGDFEYLEAEDQERREANGLAAAQDTASDRRRGVPEDELDHRADR